MPAAAPAITFVDVQYKSGTTVGLSMTFGALPGSNTHYCLKRKLTVGGSYSTVYDDTTAAFVDSGLLAETSYTYKMTAHSSSGCAELTRGTTSVETVRVTVAHVTSSLNVEAKNSARKNVAKALTTAKSKDKSREISPTAWAALDSSGMLAQYYDDMFRGGVSTFGDAGRPDERDLNAPSLEDTRGKDDNNSWAMQTPGWHPPLLTPVEPCKGPVCPPVGVDPEEIPFGPGSPGWVAPYLPEKPYWYRPFGPEPGDSDFDWDTHGRHWAWAGVSASLTRSYEDPMSPDALALAKLKARNTES